MLQPQLPFGPPRRRRVTPNTAEPNSPPLSNGSPPPDPVFLRHRRARRYIIRVQPGGIVRVTMPPWGTKRDAAAFAASQRAWIADQLRRLGDEARHPGHPGDPGHPGHPGQGAFQRLPASHEWRFRAQQVLPQRLFELAEGHGLTVRRVSVRDQKSRWGSCSRSGHICLNWRLVQMPDWIRDYVMVHELMHLKRMDHSPKFWRLVAAACPSYEEARKYLRGWQLN